MAQVLQSRSNALRSYAALALFVAVYAGVLLVILAPRDMIQAASGSVLRESD